MALPSDWQWRSQNSAFTEQIERELRDLLGADVSTFYYLLHLCHWIVMYWQSPVPLFLFGLLGCLSLISSADID
jgi:hypothetical protein